jgi:hypothetical protein
VTIAYDASRTALYAPEKQETLFQVGVSYSPVQLAVEAARLAYYRAERSASELQRLTEALSRVGFASPTMFVHAGTGAEGFGSIRHADGSALLALRGTQPGDYADLASDLKAMLVAWPESGGRVHEGFATATRALLPQIRQWMEQERVDRAKLIVAGHSLGAAMATLAASVLRSAWLVALGSPRVGDAAFVTTVQSRNTLRVVNCCDLVTEVPPAIGGYAHLNTCTYLTRNADVVLNPGRAAVLADQVVGRASYAWRHAWRLHSSVLARDLADHAPGNYARAFFLSYGSEYHVARALP